MRTLAKSLLRALLGEYSAYYIFSRSKANIHLSASQQSLPYVVKEVDLETIAAAGDSLIREQAGYAGEGALSYACFMQGKIVGVCFYWHGARYLKRNFWPLKDDEAKLVQIITLPGMRGKKVAATLIQASCKDVLDKGFRQTYARVWHSNGPSLKAFANAEWIRCALVIEINPFRRKSAHRIRFNLR